jgi:SAM-dependent methyltransferase
MSEKWKQYYSRYRNEGGPTEDTLFQQVGRTINGAPISAAEFMATVEQIAGGLEIEPGHFVFEYCCGNGLVSLELARHVRRVVGTDFSAHLIEAAQRFRSAGNVRYHVADALDPIAPFLDGEVPDRFLMASALAHFDPDDLDRLLGQLLAVAKPGGFRFLITGIPDHSRKWNFYDTPERRARHEANLAQADPINDGMGRWWTAQEIEDLARKHGLSAEVVPEPVAICNYRMSALLK